MDHRVTGNSPVNRELLPRLPRAAISLTTLEATDSRQIRTRRPKTILAIFNPKASGYFIFGALLPADAGLIPYQACQQ
jgi:hypothetical protein